MYILYLGHTNDTLTTIRREISLDNTYLLNVHWLISHTGTFIHYQTNVKDLSIVLSQTLSHHFLKLKVFAKVYVSD